MALAVDTNGMARQRSKEEIEQLLEQYQASGVTQIEFCRQTGMVRSTLGRYLRRDDFPEQRLVRVDDYRGERRNADLWVRCTRGRDTVIVMVEAKADEAFGDLIGPYYDSRIGVRSNAPARTEALRTAVFGSNLTGAIRSLRYQLLHSVAATVISAGDRNAARAIFVVHEFHSTSCQPAALARNHADWGAFVNLLAPGHQPAPAPDVTCAVLGRIVVPGGGYVRSDIPLFLGYCRTDLNGLG